MSLIENLPIPIQRHIIANFCLDGILGKDLYLDKYIIKHKWFYPRQVLLLCMERNFVTTLKILVKNHKPEDFKMLEKYILKTIGYAICREYFDALYTFMNFFIVEMCLYQSEIWELCEKIKRNTFVKRFKDNNDSVEGKLQVFYEMFIRLMFEHNKLQEFMWDKMDIYVLCPRVRTNNRVFERLLNSKLLDHYIQTTLNTDKYIYYVPNELIDTMLRVNIPISKNILYQYLSIENIRSVDISLLQRLQGLGYMSEFICSPSLLDFAFHNLSIELFKILGDYGCNYGYSLIIDKLVKSGNMELWKFIDKKYPKYVFDGFMMDLHEVYSPSKDGIPFEHAKYMLEFFNVHKIIVNADVDEFLMLAIDADDKDKVEKLLKYPISQDDIIKTYKYSVMLNRQEMSNIIYSKMVKN